MAVFMFISIWLFIVALKAFNQLKYKNYILEKINQNLSVLSNKEDFSIDNFNDNTSETCNDGEDINISSFENIKNLK